MLYGCCTAAGACAQTCFDVRAVRAVRCCTAVRLLYGVRDVLLYSQGSGSINPAGRHGCPVSVRSTAFIRTARSPLTRDGYVQRLRPACLERPGSSPLPHVATILVSVLFLQHFAKQRFWRLPGDERHVRRRRFLTPPAALTTRPAPRARRDAAGRLSRCRGGSVPYLSLGGCFVKITYIFAYTATSYSAILPNVEV